MVLVSLLWYKFWQKKKRTAPKSFEVEVYLHFENQTFATIICNDYFSLFTFHF